jgi:hypothetical protein
MCGILPSDFQQQDARVFELRYRRKRFSRVAPFMSRKHIWVVAAAFLWMPAVVSARPAEATERTAVCVVQVGGESTGKIFDFHNVSSGVLIGASQGLFLSDGRNVVRVKGEETGEALAFFDTEYGLLLNTSAGLLRYDGGQVVRPAGARTGFVEDVQKASGKLLLAGADGLFSYDGVRVAPIPGADTGGVTRLYPISSGLLLTAEKGLFFFDGAKTIGLEGDSAGRVKSVQEVSGGPLIVGESGLYRLEGNRVVRALGSDAKDLQNIYVTPRGILLSSWSNLYRYGGADAIPIEGDDTGYLKQVLDTPVGTLINAEHGLFAYDGARIKRVNWQSPGQVLDISNTPPGPLVSADTGLFRYDGGSLRRVEGGSTGEVRGVLRTGGEILLGTDNGLFAFDGTRVSHIDGEDAGAIDALHETPEGVLLSADKGFFRTVAQPLATAKAVLENVSQLKGSAPNKTGVPTRWKLAHPCAKFVDKFALQVVATNEAGEDLAERPAVDFKYDGAEMNFDAWIPVPDAGKWRFRVVSGAERTTVGAQSEPVTFTTAGFRGWLEAWWRTLAASSALLLTALNLVVFAAARYSPTAWRLATDESWGKSALLPQGLLLRQWRAAQLWLLDLYVRQRCKKMGEARPFLSLPLTNTKGELADGDSVLARLGSVRRVWVQGGAGMGKTSFFHHLHETHFGAAARTSFAIFRRDGYVLAPIEARRFANAASDDSDASTWVTECVRSVLSESGLTLDDRGLVQAMLSKGTLAVAIDGLNEVARGRAVAAFAAAFPNAPLFVTSQELGEEPFEVWRLPSTISQHVEGLLTLYLGAAKATVLTQSLKNSGLFDYLRSGYDVRLVIDLANVDPEGRNLPRDRIGLYRAAVAAVWPEGDDRLELLQAAAWKLISDRGPNEDKRRLKPDVDAPADLLERLEAVREQSGRSIRLIRAAPPGYEFVHDQMNAYLAACWFASRPSISTMKTLLHDTKAWLDGREAQRVLWGFVASLLDRPTLERLWVFSGDDEDRAVLGTALTERARREGWPLTRPAEQADLVKEAHLQ